MNPNPIPTPNPQLDGGGSSTDAGIVDGGGVTNDADIDAGFGCTTTPKGPGDDGSQSAPPDLTSSSDDSGQLLDFWLPAIDKTGIRPSRFVGTPDSVTFISASHVRIYRDTPESELAKITYQVQRDETDKENPDALVLLKTESPNVFEHDDRRDKHRRTYPILRGIRKLKFSFYRSDKGEMGRPFAWIGSWDTSKEEFKDHPYPDAIRIEVEVAGPSKLSFEGQYIFRPEAPLNGLEPSY